MFVCCFLTAGTSFAQTCPPNIGFESGDFSQWQCLAGSYQQDGSVSLVAGPPVPGRHEILSATSFPLRDPYGNFSVLCPNGSGYSVKLGNDAAGGQSEGFTYTFTIPADRYDYSIIYNYAVVFQNPNHSFEQQPRFISRAFDVTNNKYIDCGSFEFVASSGLPGFAESTVSPEVFYKPWSPITINLHGYAGHTIRLEFISNDCTLGAHFGYAYLDVNENCSSPVTGNYACAGADAITLEAPGGFSQYNWYTPDFSRLLGTSNRLTLSPPPAINTQFALEVIPFPGLGCQDTLFTVISAPLVPLELQVLDSIVACMGAEVDLTVPAVTAGSSAGLVLSYFMDVMGNDVVPAPKKVTVAGTYFIKAVNSEGCHTTDAVEVILKDKPLLLVRDPAPVHFPGTVDITVSSIFFGSEQGLTYSYWKDVAATVPLQNPFAVGESGSYYVRGVNAIGCVAVEDVKVVILPPPDPAIVVPNAFSPNGDGTNDVFRVDVSATMQVSGFSIFNRYGQMVYRTADVSRSWDGRFNGTSLPVGTYYWVLEGTERYSGRRIVRKGSVVLVR